MTQSATDEPRTRSADDDSGWTARRVATLIALVFCAEYAFMAFAFPTSVLAPIAAEFSTTQVIWVVAAFLIGAAAVAPTLGRLGDLFGKRRILVLMLLVGALGAVLASVAPSFGVVILGRVIQGVALGLPFMNASLARDVFPPRIRSVAIGLTVTGGGLIAIVASLLLGPVIGVAGWRGALWVPAIYAVVVAIVLRLVVPESDTRDTNGRLDLVGSVLVAAGVALLLIPVSLGAEWGWNSPRTIAFFVAGAVVLGAWIAHALRSRNPVIALRDFRYPPLLIAFMFAFLGIGPVPVIYSFWSYPITTPSSAGLGYGLGLGLKDIAIYTAIFSLGSLLGGFVAGRLLHERRVGPVATVTFATCAVGYVLLGFTLSSPILFGVGVFVVSLTSGSMYATVYNLVARVIRPERTASTSAAVTVGTNIGGAAYPVLIYAVINATARTVDGSPVYDLSWMRFAIIAPAASIGLMVVFAIALTVYERRNGGLLEQS